MAIAVPNDRPILARRSVFQEETSRVSTFLMLSLLILGIGGLAVLFQSASEPLPRAARTTRPTSPPVGTVAPAAPSAEQPPASEASALEQTAPSASAPASVFAAAEAPEPTAAPAASAAPAPTANRSVRVANTDGQGVVLYTAPRANGRSPRGLLEGASATVVDESVPDWTRVRAAGGLDGWVPSKYLAPVP